MVSDQRLAGETCLEVSRRIEKAADRLESQGDRIGKAENMIERLSTLVTVHAERDDERWKQLRDEHDKIWEAIQHNDERVDRLVVKDRLMSGAMNAILVIAASSVSGLLVWFLN